MRSINNKVVVIGAGMVGAAVVDAMLSLGLVSEIAVIDRNVQRAEGVALDASHTTSFAYSPNVHVHAGTFADCADAQIVVIAAGTSVQPGKVVHDRLSLAASNAAVIRETMAEICPYTTDAVLIVVSNPVDIVTYVAQNEFNYPRDHIIGTGTLLDTARLRRLIAEEYAVDTKNVHGYILGEHGDTAFAVWSMVSIAGVSLPDAARIFRRPVHLDREALVREVRQAGYHIVQLKGYTNAGVANSVGRIAKAVMLHERSVLPVSTTLTGEYGIHDVALSLPCVITDQGIGQVLEIPLSPEEQEQMHQCAERLHTVLQQLDILPSGH